MPPALAGGFFTAEPPGKLVKSLNSHGFLFSRKQMWPHFPVKSILWILGHMETCHQDALHLYKSHTPLWVWATSPESAGQQQAQSCEQTDGTCVWGLCLAVGPPGMAPRVTLLGSHSMLQASIMGPAFEPQLCILGGSWSWEVCRERKCSLYPPV